MKIVETTFERLPRERLVIGFEGENLRATVRIDCSSVFAEYPNATPTLIVKPLFADAYPVVVDRNGTDVDWLITSEILSFSGDGEIQLVFYKDQVICKSAVSKIRVCRSLTVTGDMPDPVVQWIENANRKLAEVDAQIVELEEMVDTATDAATRAEQSASTASTKAEQAAGSAATASTKAAEAQASANTATAKASEAALSATQARNSAVSAADSESGATAKAAEAAQSAQTAAQKAEEITEAAQIATGKAEEASASATAAQTSATNAASSATAAQAAQTAAKASETAAGASATQAATSVQDAGANAQTAMQKATEASQSASNAAASATNAATSAETASTKAGEAAQSAQAVEETAEQLAESLEQISQNTADIAEHEQAYNALKAATLIHSTASGAIASFADGAEMPVDEVTAQINPVQDLHGYDHPWPAGGGKNLFDASTYPTTTKAGITCTNNGDGSFTLNGTASNNVYFNIFDPQFLESQGGTPLPNGAYRITGCPTGGSTSTYYMYLTPSYTGDMGNGNTNNDTTITGGSIFIKNGYTCNNLVFRPMIRTASNGDDTFAPYSNICPITGWTAAKVTRTGKNFVDPALYEFAERTFNGLTYTVQNDGTVKVNGTPSAIGGPGLTKRFLVPPGTYVRQETGELGVFCTYRYALQETGGSAYTLPNPFVSTGKEWVYINLYCTEIKEYDNVVLYPQIELGSTATDYESYQGNTYDIAFPSEAGTVYGGELNVNADGSGSLLVDRLSKTYTGASDEGWTLSGTGTYVKPEELKKSGSVPLSNQYLMENDGGAPYNIRPIGNNNFANKNEWLAYLAENPLQVVFELAEPITYTLTASQITTLLGQNNVWSDAGDVSVKYNADTKLYIDNKITQAIAAALNS